MIKTLNFWMAIVQFLAASFAHIVGSKTLFYWCIAWCFVSIFFYLAYKEEN